MSDRMTITFEAHPISTAPKDREVYVFDGTDERWYVGIVTAHYVLTDDMWRDPMTSHFPEYPTHWAEIEDMRPGE
jgi:hypothetical protein